jgi:hypothetical protein
MVRMGLEEDPLVFPAENTTARDVFCDRLMDRLKQELSDPKKPAAKTTIGFVLGTELGEQSDKTPLRE